MYVYYTGWWCNNNNEYTARVNYNNERGGGGSGVRLKNNNAVNRPIFDKSSINRNRRRRSDPNRALS